MYRAIKVAQAPANLILALTFSSAGSTPTVLS
jgi:hypothetical protein